MSKSGSNEEVFIIAQVLELVQTSEEQFVIDFINSSFQNCYCKLFLEYQIRYVEIEILLKNSNTKENLQKCLNNHKNHLITEIKKTVGNTNSWELFEKILSLPSIEPDYFTYSYIKLSENISTKISNEIIERINKLLNKLEIVQFDKISKEENLIFQDEISILIDQIIEIQLNNYNQYLKPLQMILQCFKTIKYDENDENINCMKASICGIDLGYFLIDQDIARELLSIDEDGNEKKFNKTGTHAVCKKNGIFYKPNSNYDLPIAPQREFAISSMYKILECGKGISETTLLKIRNVKIENQFKPMEEIVQASYSIEGILFEDFMEVNEIIPFCKRCLETNKPNNINELRDSLNWIHLQLENLKDYKVNEKNIEIIEKIEKYLRANENEFDFNENYSNSNEFIEFLDFYFDLKAFYIFCGILNKKQIDQIIIDKLSKFFIEIDASDKIDYNDLKSLYNYLKVLIKNNENEFIDKLATFILDDLIQIQIHLDESDSCFEIINNKGKFDICQYIYQNSITELFKAIAIIQLYPELSTQKIQKNTIEKEKQAVSICAIANYYKKVKIFYKRIILKRIKLQNENEEEISTKISSSSLLLSHNDLDFTNSELTYLENVNRFDLFNEIQNVYSKINQSLLSVHFIASLLTNPSDHKPDNFIVTNSSMNEDYEFDLIGIDNDQALNCEEYNIRSIIYLLNPFMNNKIDEKIKNLIINKGPGIIMIDWIIALHEQNQKYEHWIKQGILSKKDLITEENQNKLEIPLKIERGLLTYIYEKLKRLYNIFISDNHHENSLTHWKILSIIQNNVKKSYSKSLKINSLLSDSYKYATLNIKIIKKENFIKEKVDVTESAIQLFSETIKVSSLSFVDDKSLYILEQIYKYFPIISNQIRLPGNPKFPESRKEIFFRAIEKGYCNMVGRLLEEERINMWISTDKNPNLHYYTGSSPFIYSLIDTANTISNSQKILSSSSSCLLDLRNDCGQNGLLLACYQLDFEMIRILFLLYKSDPNILDEGKRNSIYIIIRYFRENPQLVSSIIHLLGSHSSSILWNQYCGDSEKLPLQYLIDCLDDGFLPEISEPLVEYLVLKGSSPDYINLDGESSLDIAIRRKNKGIIRKLIQLGAGNRLNKIHDAIEFFLTNKDDKILNECFLNLFSNSLYFRWILTLNQFINICKNPNKSKAKINILIDSMKNIETNENLNENYNFYNLYDLQLSKDIFNQNLFDENGNLIKFNKYGRRNVNKIEILIPELNIKQLLFLKQNPELPGIEYAVNQLLFLIFGHGTSFSTLFNFFVNKNDDFQTDSCNLDHSNSFKSYNPFVSYPILLSQGIYGTNLHEILADKKNQFNFEQNMDKNSFCELFLVSLLINYEDAKPDNFIVEKNQKTGKYILICIDNDHAFVPDISKKNDKTILVKCILYCFNLMNEIIHPIARKKFLSISIEKILKKWLFLISKRNYLYYNLFSKSEKSKYSNINQSETYLLCPFRKGSIAEIYEKFQRIQILLHENSNVTCMEILRNVMPAVGIRYEEAHKNYNHIINRFLDVGGNQYSMIMDKRIETLVNSRECLRQMEIPNQKNFQIFKNIESAMEELEYLKYEMNDIRQNKILNDLKQLKFKSFNSLLLNSEKSKIISKIDFSLLKIHHQVKLLIFLIHSGNYQSFRLNNCSVCSILYISHLIDLSPNLKTLELNNCSTLYIGEFFEECHPFHLSSITLKSIKMKQKINFQNIPTLHTINIIQCSDIETLSFSTNIKYIHIENCLQLTKLEPIEFQSVKHFFWTKNIPTIKNDFIIEKLSLSVCRKLDLYNMFSSYFHSEKTSSIVLFQFPLFFTRKNLFDYFSCSIHNLSSASILNSLFYYFNIIDRDNKFIIPDLFFLNCILQNIDILSYFSFTSIDFYHCNKFLSNDSLKIIIKHCANKLNGISLKDCSNFDDDTLLFLSDSCNQLSFIDFSGCFLITDDAFISFCNNNSSTLSTVILKDCSQISDKSIDFLLQNCKNLLNLNIYGCQLCEEFLRNSTERYKHMLSILVDLN